MATTKFTKKTNGKERAQKAPKAVQAPKTPIIEAFEDCEELTTLDDFKHFLGCGPDADLATVRIYADSLAETLSMTDEVLAELIDKHGPKTKLGASV